MTKYEINTVYKINNKPRVVDTGQDQKVKHTRDLKAFRSIMLHQVTHGDWYLAGERCSGVNVICLDGAETFVLVIMKLFKILKIRSHWRQFTYLEHLRFKCTFWCLVVNWLSYCSGNWSSVWLLGKLAFVEGFAYVYFFCNDFDFSNCSLLSCFEFYQMQTAMQASWRVTETLTGTWRTAREKRTKESCLSKLAPGGDWSLILFG